MRILQPHHPLKRGLSPTPPAGTPVTGLALRTVAAALAAFIAAPLASAADTPCENLRLLIAKSYGNFAGMKGKLEFDAGKMTYHLVVGETHGLTGDCSLGVNSSGKATQIDCIHSEPEGTIAPAPYRQTEATRQTALVTAQREINRIASCLGGQPTVMPPERSMSNPQSEVTSYHWLGPKKDPWRLTVQSHVAYVGATVTRDRNHYELNSSLSTPSSNR